MDFNKPLEKVTFPNQLQSLRFGHRFKKPGFAEWLRFLLCLLVPRFFLEALASCRSSFKALMLFDFHLPILQERLGECGLSKYLGDFVLHQLPSQLREPTSSPTRLPCAKPARKLLKRRSVLGVAWETRLRSEEQQGKCKENLKALLVC